MFLCDFKDDPCFFSSHMSVSLLQVGTDKCFLPHTHDAAHPPINKTTTGTNDVSRLHDDLVIFLSSYILLWFHLHALL